MGFNQVTLIYLSLSLEEVLEKLLKNDKKLTEK